MCPHCGYIAECPLPGERIDGRVVIASGWHRDDVIAVLSLNSSKPYYRIDEFPVVPEDEEGTKLFHYSDEFENIVPAAREFDERFGLWAG